jgi:pimeloyl-ACP methyl ester carboxylesterase
MRRPSSLLALALGAALGGADAAGAGEARPPAGRELQALVRRYLAADEAERARLRAQADAEIAPLDRGSLPALRTAMLDAALDAGPRLGASATQYLLGEGRGKVLVRGRAGRTLFLGLHGGGVGAGDAESAASAMGGGGWWWVYPEVLEKTERGWTTSGTEEFVLAVVDAAKRTRRLDPDRVFVVGHSMGGYGAWTLGARHADVFAGVGAYAGAPSPIWRSPTDLTVTAIEPGILPSYHSLPLFVYQSLDDLNVPPAANQFAMRALAGWRERFPDGFPFRYEEVDGRGHGPPKEGYLPSLRWLAGHARDPRPRRFLWQPVLTWKRQFYWLAWQRPELGALLEVAAPGGNRVEVTVHEGAEDLTGASVLLGPPLVDLEGEVVVAVGGRERFRGRVPRTFSTLLLTLPRLDPDLLFDARVDL